MALLQDSSWKKKDDWKEILVLLRTADVRLGLQDTDKWGSGSKAAADGSAGSALLEASSAFRLHLLRIGRRTRTTGGMTGRRMGAGVQAEEWPSVVGTQALLPGPGQRFLQQRRPLADALDSRVPNPSFVLRPEHHIWITIGIRRSEYSLLLPISKRVANHVV